MRVLVIAIALTLALCAMAFAGANPDAKIAIHVRNHNAKAACTITPAIVTCADVVTTNATGNFDAFPVFFDLTEYQGVEFGVTWPVWAYSADFTNCADLVIGEIKNPGDGSSHAWTTCQYGVAAPCFLWMYADAGGGMICPIPHPIAGAISIVDCAEGVDTPMCIFCAGVYGMVGDDPCAPTATEPSSWGEIKGMFR